MKALYAPAPLAQPTRSASWQAIVKVSDSLWTSRHIIPQPADIAERAAAKLVKAKHLVGFGPAHMQIVIHEITDCLRLHMVGLTYGHRTYAITLKKDKDFITATVQSTEESE